jgi:glutamyl-tRNA synthetase
LPVQSEEIQEEIEGQEVKKKRELPQGMTDEVIRKLVPLVKERIKKLSDFVPLVAWMFEEVEYDQAVFDRLKITDIKQKTEKVLEKLEQMEKPWQKETFEQTFQDLAKELELNNTQMFQLLRVAISGQLVTPPLFESIEILGEEKTLERIKLATTFQKDNS